MRVRMSWATMSWATKSWATLAALLLAAISVAVTLSLIDYPLGVAWDELVKLRGGSEGGPIELPNPFLQRRTPTTTH